MINEQEQYIIPYIRTFKIENIPRVKISLIDEKSKLNINRLFIPIESNRSFQNQYDNKQNSITNIPLISDEIIHNIETSSKTQQIMNIIDHRQVYNHKQQLQSSSDNPIEHSVISSNKIDSSSRVIQVDQPLSSTLSQLIPDSIINDKQATNRIFNEKNSTHFTHLSKFITLTPNDSSQNKISKSIDDNLSSSNHIRYYEIGSILTSTSAFIMHKNDAIAHATTSDPFFSDTIFIILIVTLTIIILLFCLGLFCLCRRTTKRNISPSFDGGSYSGLNGQSYSIPIDNYQQENSKYENNIPLSTIPTRLSIKQATLTNDRVPLIQPVALHQTVIPKIKINNKKLKKKRLGFCCCNSKKSSLSTTINARTRMNNNDM